MTRHGLTLVELLVSLVVIALVVTAGYATFAFVADRRGEAEGALDPVVRAAMLRHTLVNWWSLGVFTPYYNSGGVVRLGLADDYVRFRTSALTPLRTTPVIVFLYVNTSDVNAPRGLVAVLTSPDDVAPATQNGAPPLAIPDSLRLQLDPTITRMQVEFLTDTANGRRWMPVQEFIGAGGTLNGKPKNAPIALRFTFFSPAGLHPLLQLPIVVPMRGVL